MENKEEVKKYVQAAKKKTEIERTGADKEKTGVELRGVKAINPANGEEIPIFVAHYVLTTYGTGAIMAVPAHDERDWQFAKKYKLPIKKVSSAPYFYDVSNPFREGKKNVFRNVVHVVVRNPKTDEVLCLRSEEIWLDNDCYWRY